MLVNGTTLQCTFLVIVDAYGKWPEVRLVSSTTTQNTIAILADVRIRNMVF